MDASQSLESGALLSLMRDFPEMFEHQGRVSYPLMDRGGRSSLSSPASAKSESRDNWTTHSRLVQKLAPELRRTWQLGREQAMLQLQSVVVQSMLRVQDARERLEALLSSEQSQLERLGTGDVQDQLDLAPGRPPATGKPQAPAAEAQLNDLTSAIDGVRDLSGVLQPLRRLCAENAFLLCERHAVWARLAGARRDLLRGVLRCVDRARELIASRLRVVVRLHGRPEVSCWRRLAHGAFQHVEQFNRHCQHWDRAMSDDLRCNSGTVRGEDGGGGGGGGAGRRLKPIPYSSAVRIIALEYGRTLGARLMSSVYPMLWNREQRGDDVAEPPVAAAATTPTTVSGKAVHEAALARLDRQAFEFAVEMASVAACLPLLFGRWSSSDSLEGIRAPAAVRDRVAALVQRVSDDVYEALITSSSAAAASRRRKTTPPVRNGFVPGAGGGAMSSAPAGAAMPRAHGVELMPRPAPRVLEVMAAQCSAALLDQCAVYLAHRIAARADGRMPHGLVTLTTLWRWRSDADSSTPDALRPVSRAWDKTVLWLELHHMNHAADQALSKAVVQNATATARLKLNVETGFVHGLLPSVARLMTDGDSRISVPRPLVDAKMKMFFRTRSFGVPHLADDDDDDEESAVGNADTALAQGISCSNYALLQDRCLAPVMSQCLSLVERRHPLLGLSEEEAASFGCNLHQVFRAILLHTTRTMRALLRDMFNGGAAPPLLAVVHGDLPWIASAVEACVLSLQTDCVGVQLMTPDQLEDLRSLSTTYTASVAKAQTEFEAFLGKCSESFWEGAFPVSNTWKKSPRGVDTWIAGGYMQSSVESLLQPSVEVLLRQPVEVQRRGIEFTLQVLLKSLAALVLRMDSIKFSAHGARQLDADIGSLKTWLGKSDSGLDSRVSQAVASGRVFRRWARIIGLLTWQPGSRYSGDTEPRGIHRLLPPSAGRGRSRTLRHRNRIAPMAAGDAEDEVDGGNDDAMSDAEDRKWLALRVQKQEKGSRSCVIL